jgi:hypothetical protein
MDAAHHRRDELDRKYRAKVIVLLLVFCVGLWAAVGALAVRSL